MGSILVNITDKTNINDNYNPARNTSLLYTLGKWIHPDDANRNRGRPQAFSIPPVGLRRVPTQVRIERRHGHIVDRSVRILRA